MSKIFVNLCAFYAYVLDCYAHKICKRCTVYLFDNQLYNAAALYNLERRSIITFFFFLIAAFNNEMQYFDLSFSNYFNHRGVPYTIN